MHPEKPDCRYCGGCQDKHTEFGWLNVQDSSWLEEMGDLITAAVKGVNKVPSYSYYCHQRLATCEGLYS